MTEVVVQSTPVTVVVEDEVTGIISVIATGPQGPQGPKGDPGNTNIGGYPVSISNINVGDILAFNGNDWFNNPQAQLTDGGNF